MQALNAALKAVDAELQAQSTGASTRRCKVDYYEWLKQVGEYQIYRIWVSDDLKLREDAEVTLKAPLQTLTATVISVEDAQCFSARLPQKLTQDVYNISWNFNSGFILRALGEALANAASGNSKILKSLCAGLGDNLDLAIDDDSDFVEELNTAQQQAILLAEKKQLSLVWGPPGTGKTHTLAHAIYRAYLRDDTVLVLSTSNVAIDQVLLYLDKHIYADEQRYIVRLGYTDNEVCHRYIQERPEFTGFSIIFSTLATAVLKGDQLRGAGIDLVVVDEASMVSMPYALVAASLAQRNIIFSGDFRQLPPISHVDGSVMGENIFDYLDVPSAIDAGQVVPYMAMLDTQYRMSPAISEVVSDLFYNGLLKCGRTAGDEGSLEFIDVNKASGYADSYYSVEYRSYYNPISLGIIKSNLKDWATGGSRLLFISPYRAQQNLISYSFIDEKLNSASSLTVHRAQGAEADVVVFDLTTHAKSSKFELAKMFTSSSTPNLVNVAMSRAIKKLVIIGNQHSIREMAATSSFWKQFYSKIESHFSTKNLNLFLDSLENFSLTFGEEKSALAVDIEGRHNYLEAMAQSKAEKKVYVSTFQIPLTQGVTGRTVNSTKFPDFLIWGEQIVLKSIRGDLSFSQRMAAEVLKKISVGHLVDTAEPDRRNTHVLSCGRCGSNKDLVYDNTRYCCVLRCSNCGERTFITDAVANDLKAVLQIRCPDCSSDMKARKKRGARSFSFFGCTNYPKCHGLVDFRDFVTDYVNG
ncbi:DEAD/DEAH box helicase [Motiliproteus sp. MSK22-1]|uniref:DEAD/DEAH box helicase n=1 Tax=Motiliproteus sp. MSK22-1 TaxID=1897630 RepID=UPI0009786738|nr:AAA domain-containing protein [Motiliproteus sp. MSK22-1]OMH26237.1 hypothetical protein BGP75_00985 [Motiliproteus sp. MSK22-1]